MTSRTLLAGASVLLLAACNDAARLIEPADGPLAGRSPGATLGAPGRTLTLASALDPALCVGTANDATEAGTRVVSATCSGSATQRLTPSAAGELRTENGLCVALAANGARVGAAVTLAGCTGQPTQRWTLTSGGAVVNANGRCLEVPGAAKQAGAALASARCVTAARQQWIPAPVPGAEEPDTMPGASPLPSDTTPTPQDTTPDPEPPPAPAPAPPPAPAPLPPTSPPGVIPELPRATVNVSMPVQTGRVISVPAGGNLQAALDEAQPGDVVSLAPGATYSGFFYLRPKTGNGVVVVRTGVSDAALGAPGTRMTPARAASANLARIVTNRNAEPAIQTEGGVSNWRITGVELSVDPAVSILYEIVRFGTAGQWQDTEAEIPRNLVLDRVWVHGIPTLSFTRCVALNSGATAVVDSYISECHARDFDSQAIGGWNGPGPFLIQNNYLAGAAETILFGGAEPSVPGVVPSDVTIRGNHFHKPLAWKGVWQVKNILELKAGRRVLVERNLFDGVWQDAQTGFAWVLKGATAPTEDITLRHNVVRNAGGGVGFEGNTPNNLARVRVEGNLFERINVPGSPYQGAGNMVTFGGYNNGGPVDVQVVRNTFGATGAQTAGGDGINVCLLLASPQLTRMVFSENVCPNIILGDGGHPAIWGLNRYAPGYTVERNLIVGNHLGERDPYPASTLFAATPNEAWANPAAGDWTLRNAAWAGIGVSNLPALRAMAAAVVANGN